MNKAEDIEKIKARFEKLVVKQKGCWSWRSAKNNRYKNFKIHGKQIGAHRASWMIYKGEIPDGMCVLHKCDNPICTNPEHLFLGTHEDNIVDMYKKGRSAFKKKVVDKRRNTRLSVDMDSKMHRDLKAISAFRNCSMRKLVLRALIAFIKHEEKFNK